MSGATNKITALYCRLSQEDARLGESQMCIRDSIRGEFFNMNVFVRFLDELLNILDLLFLYFDFLLDREG